MNYRWKEFERGMRARVRPYDAARRMSFWRRVEHRLNSIPQPPFWILRGIPTVILLILLKSNYEGLWDVDTTLGAFSVWLLVAVGFRCLLLRDMEAFPEVSLLKMLPVAPLRGFWHSVWLTHEGTVWVFVENLAPFGVVASFIGPQIPWGIVVGMSVLGVSFYLALAALLVRVRIAGEIMVITGLNTTVFLILADHPQMGAMVRELFYWVNPFGWVNGFFLQWVAPHRAGGMWGLIPVSAVLLTMPWSIAALRERYLRNELRLRPGMRWKKKYLIEESASVVTDRILSGEFLRERNWARTGLVERLVARLLTREERRVLDVFGRPPMRWTEHFWIFLVLVGAMVGTTVLFTEKDFWEFVESFVKGKNGFRQLAALALTTVIWWKVTFLSYVRIFLWWETLERRGKPGERLAFPLSYRLLPLSFWDTGKLLVKVDTILLLLCVPVAVVLSMTWPAQLFAKEPVGGFFMGKLLIMTWCFVTLGATYFWTPSIFEGWKYWRFGLARFGLMIVATAGLLGLLAAPFFQFGWIVAFADVLLATSWFVFAAKRYRGSLK
jgi:hypothetical protein